MLELSHIDLTFSRNSVDSVQLFRDFSLQVKKGEFLSIVGSNGSGKTTLLNLICGTLRPDSGTVILNRQDITAMPEYRRAAWIGRVFQDPKSGTCSELTVLENFALADNKGKPYALSSAVSKKRIAVYKELLASCNMGLEDRLNAKVGTLSGGQRQAIALLLTGMADVDLLILDEHTAALDPKSSETIMELTDRLIREKNLTAVMVTHNLRFAVQYGTRLLMMHDGQIVIDKAGAEKAALGVNDLLTTFNQISIECGN